MTKNYIPARGDLIWLEFNPQTGREQAGKRPALVISPIEYNSKVGLFLVCPVTSNEKGYPFEVKLPEKFKIKGVILSDHLKSLDWHARKAQFIIKVPDKIISEVMAKINTLLE